MRRWTIIAAAALSCTAVTLSVPGCSDDGDTFITQVVAGPSDPGNFPGAPVTDHDVATDTGGLSEPGFAWLQFIGTAPNTVDLIRYFPSGAGNTGILLTIGIAGSNFTLFAQHYDGTNFTPPVALAGGNQDPAGIPLIQDAVVTFLNMPGNARNGDALIFWRRSDLDDFNSATIAGPNLRLYYSYLDVSGRANPASGTNNQIRYGFDSLARTVDTVDEDAGAGTNQTHVLAFGGFSDGYHGAAKFIGSGTAAALKSDYQQGDTVGFAGVVWTQAATSSDLARMWFATFDLSAGNTTNGMGTPATLGLDATSFTVDTDFVRPEISTYDGSVFLSYIDAATGDSNLVWQVFGSSAASTSFLTNGFLVNPDGSGDGRINVSSGPELGNYGGPDEGLVNLLGIFEQSNFTAASNNDLYAVQFDPGAGTYAPANDRVEIDADTATNNGNQPVSAVTFVPGTNRTLDLLHVTWLQPRTNNGTDDGIALWTQCIQTTTSGTAPAIGTRTAGTGAVQLDAVTSGANTTGDQVQQFKMQGNVGPGCSGVQSDRFSWHLIWQQDNNPDTLDRLRTRKVTFTPSATTANPVALTLGTERTEDFNAGELANTQSAASPGGWGAVTGADGGGTGGTTGELILYYVRNITATASTLPPSFRAFQKIGNGTPRQIGSLVGGTGAARECVDLRVVLTPTSADTTGSPDWAGTGHHIFLSEIRDDNPGSGAGNEVAMRHRFYDINSTASPIENRFIPAVSSSSAPATLDNVGGGTTSFAPAALTDGSGGTLGAFWAQGGHLWYQQWHPVSRSWLTRSGLITPELVDNHASEAVQGLGIGIHSLPTDPCANLRRFILFYLKPDNAGTNRWHARIRD